MRLVLLLAVLILISGCVQEAEKECETKEDCSDKTCFTKDCIDNNCSYSPLTPCPHCDDKDDCTKDSFDYEQQQCINEQITPCCGNQKCEIEENYENCADCPHCDDKNDCTVDEYDYDKQECENKLIPDVVCCGNGKCELGETYIECAEDCEKPNIVLIYVDTIRADHLGSYGYERETSPNIDGLADNGVLFLNHITQGPSDLPATPSFLTSLYPPAHEFYFTDGSIGPEFTTLAEVLKENGYETAGFFGSKPWFSEDDSGLMQGFNTFTVTAPGDYKIHENVLLWLEQNKKKPFFLMVQYDFTHGPYDAPEPYKKMFVGDEYYNRYPNAPSICEDPWIGIGCIPGIVAEDGILDLDYYVAKFDGEIRYTDELVAELAKEIKNIDIADNTILIFMGDHGESLGAHNIFLHHQFLYDDTIKTPLIIKYPPKIPKNKTITNQVQSIDLYPTILDLADIPIPVNIDGISLMPLIDGTSNRECNAFSFEGDWAVIRTKKWKYIINDRTESRELYDLESDPYELTNKESQNYEIARQLRTKANSCRRGDCPSDC